MNANILMYKLSKYQYLLSINSSNDVYKAKIQYYKNQLGGNNENKCNPVEILGNINYNSIEKNFQDACFIIDRDNTATKIDLDIDKKIKDEEENRKKWVDKLYSNPDANKIKTDNIRFYDEKIRKLRNKRDNERHKIYGCQKYIRENKCK